MKSKIEKYYPLIPVLVAYLVIFLIGLSIPGMWQMAAMLAFYCAIGQSWNIFMGMTGYVDFGYVTFIALGAYGMAIGIYYFNTVEGIGFGVIFIGWILALFLASLSALLEAFIALRLSGAYFAIACIGINEGVKHFIEGMKLWGGSEGMLFSKIMYDTMGRQATNELTTFWADVVVFLVAILAAVINIYFMRSKIGFALTAVREDEAAAKVMGIDTNKYKTLAFMASGLLGATAGAFYWAIKMTHVYPDEVFVIHYTIECIVVVLLGGAGTLLGPVIGGLIYALSKYWLAVIMPGFQLLVFAPIIIIVIVAVPGGVVGLIKEKVRGTVLDKFII